MYIMLLYDISSDRIRNKIADTCLNYGLDRTQYSAFVGDLSRNHQEELMLKCTRLLGDEPGALLLVPIDWERRVECRNVDETDKAAPAEWTPPDRTGKGDPF